MYRLLERSTERVLGYELSGTLDQAQVEEIHRHIEDALERHDSVRFLIVFSDLDLPTPAAVWEDLKLTRTYLRAVERYALVGPARWQQALASVSDALTKGAARYFPPARLDEAWAWALEGEEVAAS